MTRLALALIACGTALVPVLSSVPVHAQNAESWISGDTGNDNNLCNRVLPCKTLPGALAVTSANGQIRCIDPPAQTAAVATITKSVTIDCAEAIITCGADAITINVAGSVTDTLRTVRLRNLSINGIRHCPPVSGIRIVNAAVVSIEHVVVEGFGGRGIVDARTTGGRLTVANSTLRNNGGSGLLVFPPSGSPRIDVAVDNVAAEGNTYGMAFANGVKAMVSRSLIPNNVNVGPDAENVPGGSGAEVAVDNGTISNNGTGLYTSGGAIMDVSNSNIVFNAVGANGAWLSFGNNRVHRNTAAGTLPMAMGAITHDVGQQ
jgi:hypothetical protein